MGQEVIIMTQGYTLQELMQEMKGNTITQFISDQHGRFQERFGMNYDETVSVTLKFQNEKDSIDFYNEIKYNTHYNKDYTVSTVISDPRQLVVMGAETLYDYFGSREPNLLTISRDYGIAFDIEFIQQFSGTVFTGSVNRGELLSRQCIIEVSNVLPELALGGLVQIGRNDRDFNDLLTRCYIVKGYNL